MLALRGNRLSIIDPNAGEIKSTYNKFNELIKQIDARGDTTMYQYDKLGRITQKRYSAPDTVPLIINYTYDQNYPNANNKGKGKLFQIKKNNGVEEQFIYDHLSRLITHNKSPGTFKYSYNATGQLETLTYPHNFGVTYSYTATGKLNEIRRTDDDSLIYKVLSRNKFGATTLCEYGNGVATAYTYNPYGLLTRIHTGDLKDDIYSYYIGDDRVKGYDSVPGKGGFYTADSTILNYRYGYNDCGLMTSRSESVANQLEVFTYDHLNRLDSITSGSMGATGTTQTFSYFNNGNIDHNSNVGNYHYLSNKPHAVTQITAINNEVISDNDCAVTYNFFNQPTEITEGDYKFDISYNLNQQRNTTTRYQNGSKEIWHRYNNKYYECETDYTTDSARFYRFFHYIYGDNGVVALHTSSYGTNDTIKIFQLDSAIMGHFHLDSVIMELLQQCRAVPADSLYYIHTDHLGSYCALTNANKQIRQYNRFDPWGNYEVRYDTIYKKKPSFKIIENNFPLTCRGRLAENYFL